MTGSESRPGTGTGTGPGPGPGTAGTVRLRGLRMAALLLLVLPGGCRMPPPEWVGGDDLAIPATWTSGAEENSGDVAFGWLREFEDPEMERLVAEAIEYNQDLLVAAARLRSVEEGTILGRAARLPRIDASVSGSYSETRIEDDAGDFQINTKDSSLSLNASWELDLWGRLADLHRATIEDYRAQLADYRGARLSLAANTAKAWFNLITARQQLVLARQTRDAFQRNYQITERNYRAGDPTASSLDVNFGRNQVASAERSLIARELSRDEARRSLELLLGRYPATLIEGRDELPALARSVPAGLPSELLMRRPDLVAAAGDLRASADRASAARKALLPSINLSVGGSTTEPSLELLELIRDPVSLAWSVAASLAQPIYRGGALRASARQALAQNDIAVASFSAIALRAFREVESALATERSLERQEEFLKTELEQANLAEAQAYRDYTEGIVGILSVLEAQRRAFNARSSMISLQNDRLQNRIDLHLALGGDFEEPPPEPGEPGPDSAESSSRDDRRIAARTNFRRTETGDRSGRAPEARTDR